MRVCVSKGNSRTSVLAAIIVSRKSVFSRMSYEEISGLFPVLRVSSVSAAALDWANDNYGYTFRQF